MFSLLEPHASPLMLRKHVNSNVAAVKAQIAKVEEATTFDLTALDPTLQAHVRERSSFAKGGAATATAIKPL